MLQDKFRYWVWIGVLMLPLAFLFDTITQIQPCTLCWLQRLLLFTAAAVMWLFASKQAVRMIYMIGLLVCVRHLYLIYWAPATTGCLPPLMLSGIPLDIYPQYLLHWLGQVGRTCGQGHIILDTMFISMLLAYYSIGMLLSSQVILGFVYERIRSN